MASVSGLVFLNTVDFVCSTYGRDAHARILQELPSDTALFLDTAALFRCEATEAPWLPLEALLAYMETGKRVLAPDDPGFFRNMGFYGALHHRSQPFAMTLSDSELAADYARVLWQFLFDAGECQVEQTGLGEATVRIRRFPTHAALCQRILGSLEGVLTALERPARAEERACVLAGDPYCEFRVFTTPTDTPA